MIRPPSMSDSDILNTLASGDTSSLTEGDWTRVASMEEQNNSIVAAGGSAIYNYPTSGGGASASTGTGTTDTSGNTTQTDTRSAYDAQMDYMSGQETRRQNNLIATMRSMMAQNGMSELLAGMEKYVRKGYSGDDLWIMVSNDPAYNAAYNKRFAANARRASAGLPQLLPATYIELEQGYRTAMMNRGMPEGLFDSEDDFTDLIAKDISVREVEDRLDLALDYINFSGNDGVKQELREIYGMTDSEMAAYVIDPGRTADYLERESNKRFRQASVGGAAENQGVSLADDLRNEIASMYSANTWQSTFADSQQKFTSVAQQSPLYKRLGLLSDVETSSDDLVKESFNTAGAAEAASKKGKLASQERARFGGRSALSKSSLAQKRVR
jgi:hypothetical protein